MRIRDALIALALFLCAGPLASQSAPVRLRLVAVTRIAIPAAEGRVAGVVTGSRGEVFALFPQAGVVRVFGSDGTPRREIRGQRGRAGPAGAFRLSFFRDTLVMGSRSRLAMYEPGGRFLRTVTFSVPVGGRGMDPASPVALLADGTVLSVPGLVSTAVAEGRVRAVPLLRTARQGTILDTIGWRSVRNGIMQVRDPVDVTRRIYTEQPWRDGDLFALSPDGRWMAVVTREVPRERGSAAFRVTRLSPEGDTLSSRLISYTPVPLGDEAVERMLTLFAESPSFTVGGRSMKASIREALYVPRFLPPVSQVVAGSDGTLWLRREVVPGETVRWDVLDSQSRKVGEVFTHESFRLLEARSGEVWGVQGDGLELTRFRVQQAEG